MREAWLKKDFGTAAPVASPVALVRDAAALPGPGQAMDLRRDIFSGDWWRAFATLLLLLSAAAALAPGFEPLPGGTGARAYGEAAEEWAAGGVGSLAKGSRSGIRMAAGAHVEPIAEAPERASIDLYATIGRGGLLGSLLRIGAAESDSVTVAGLVRAEAPRLRPGTTVAITLGRKGPAGRRPVERVALRSGIDMRLIVERGESGFTLAKAPIPVDRTPLRIRGRAGDGLYWALRSAGVSSQAATTYLKALATQIDVGEITADDRFDLVLANRRAATGESQSGPLLYAGLDRDAGSDLQLILWNLGGRATWVDAADAGKAQAGSALAWPVAARITSGFGMRVHPILRFARMHRGIDFAAAHGTPIYAAADGQVSKAGWAGGYGRQVRMVHGGGLATSYSHMSRMVVDEGMLVRQGQLIGYVGSSGLSTGPHLHYEVYRGGVAVNPMSVRFAASPGVDQATANAMKARLKALLSVGTKKGS